MPLARDTTTKAMPRSRLLSLPAELQLIIFEFAVRSDLPLLANCLCDSSYDGFTEAYHEDHKRWEEGVKRPPEQPALTRTCRRIRCDTIPMFYKLNSFEAGYCHVTDTKGVIRWLRALGPQNRTLFKSFRFFDANPDHDRYNDKIDLKALLRGPVVREMGGTVISTYADGCSHEVKFSMEEVNPLDGLDQLFGHSNDNLDLDLC